MSRGLRATFIGTEIPGAVVLTRSRRFCTFSTIPRLAYTHVQAGVRVRVTFGCV